MGKWPYLGVSDVSWLTSQGVRRKWSALCEALGPVPGSQQCQQQLLAIIILLVAAVIPSPGSLGPLPPARSSSPVPQTRTDVQWWWAYARSGAPGGFRSWVSSVQLPPVPIAQDNLELLVALLLLSDCWGFRCVPPCPVYEVPGTEPRALYVFGKHSSSWALLPVLAMYLF